MAVLVVEITLTAQSLVLRKEMILSVKCLGCEELQREREWQHSLKTAPRSPEKLLCIYLQGKQKEIGTEIQPPQMHPKTHSK